MDTPKYEIALISLGKSGQLKTPQAWVQDMNIQQHSANIIAGQLGSLKNRARAPNILCFHANNSFLLWSADKSQLISVLQQITCTMGGT